MNAATFEDWVEKCLVPVLSEGDVVVMDNLSSHKGARVTNAASRRSIVATVRGLPPAP